MDDEPPGSNCVAGGTVVNAGIDADDDGVLDDDEITDTSYVCHGINGSDGDNGTDGADGDNGTDGIDGMTALLRFDDEPAGDNCPAGGTVVSMGFDADTDGVLDNEEIDDSAYVCNGTIPPGGDTVLYGHVTIINSSDVALLTGYTAITGHLYVNDTLITDLDGLESLTSIEQHLIIQNNPYLTDVDGLSSLTTVGTDVGNVTISGNTELTNLAGLDNLTSIVGTLGINNNAALTSITGLSKLETVGGSLVIGNDDALTDLEALSVGTVGVDFIIRDNEMLTGLCDLSGLTSIGNDLIIRDNPSLTNLDGLSVSMEIGGNLHILNNGELPTCVAESFRDELISNGFAGTATICGTKADACGSDPCP